MLITLLSSLPLFSLFLTSSGINFISYRFSSLLQAFTPTPSCVDQHVRVSDPSVFSVSFSFSPPSFFSLSPPPFPPPSFFPSPLSLFPPPLFSLSFPSLFSLFPSLLPSSFLPFSSFCCTSHFCVSAFCSFFSRQIGVSSAKTLEILCLPSKSQGADASRPSFRAIDLATKS